MREDVQQLLKIQDLDQRIVAIGKELERIPREQEAAKDRLANNQAALASAKTAYQENEMAIKTVELDIGTRK
ncbi:hypothetical protein N9F36_05310, partial [Akkermansiaceae bacterium]|nr:hypothetical protein [Akkermansiaceae bacterium]